MTLEEFMNNFDVDIMQKTAAKIDKSKQAEDTETVTKRMKKKLIKLQKK